MRIKEILKKNISKALFDDLSCFVEELYLTDCDYLVLMARKFFNLFWVFHELNCEKYQELGIPYYNDKIKVVSDRALPVLQNEFKKGGCRIVIGDDIIIHGRGIRNLYDKILDACPDIDISIETFIINNDETSIYNDIINKIHFCYEGTTDKWRDISNRIVATFLLSGRPYISYLPYFVLDTTWNDLSDKLDQKDCFSVTNNDFKYYGLDFFVYFGKGLEVLRNLNCCDIAAMRFYYYKGIGRILAIPYFCTSVIDNSSIIGFTDMFREELFTDEYILKIRENSGAEDMRLMEFEYTMSLLLSIHLLNGFGIKVKKWSREIEAGTFSEYLIDKKSFEEIDSDYYIRKVNDIDGGVKKGLFFIPDNEKELKEKYLDVQKINRDVYKLRSAKTNWLGNILDNDVFIAQYIEKILLINGNIDEERCNKKNNKEKTRMLGVPLSYILADSANYWSSINDQAENDYFKKRIFTEIIQAVDSGKGSIVIRSLHNQEEEEIRESLLHAGEQNYKYYELTNYPFMYGLMLIEHYARTRKLFTDVRKMKERYQAKFDSWLDKQNVIYDRKEQNELMGFNILNEFGRLLIDVYKKYEGNKVLTMATEYAHEVMAEA